MTILRDLPYDIPYDDDSWARQAGWRLRGGGQSWDVAETLLVPATDPGRDARPSHGLVALDRSDRADFYAHDGYKDAELVDAEGVTSRVHIDGAGVLTRAGGTDYVAVLYWTRWP